jgi:hypothetical protein
MILGLMVLFVLTLVAMVDKRLDESADLLLAGLSPLISRNRNSSSRNRNSS